MIIQGVQQLYMKLLIRHVKTVDVPQKYHAVRCVDTSIVEKKKYYLHLDMTGMMG